MGATGPPAAGTKGVGINEPTNPRDGIWGTLSLPEGLLFRDTLLPAAEAGSVGCRMRTKLVLV
eukprot:1160736-Pelagomonas_calceolata.AAC.5